MHKDSVVVPFPAERIVRINRPARHPAGSLGTLRLVVRGHLI